MADSDAQLQARYGAKHATGSVVEDPILGRILGRRTHRQYAPRPVPPDLIDELLLVALSASSKSDFQQASVIIVRDPERRRRLGELVPAMPWIGGSPAFLVFCGDARRLEKVCELRNHPNANANLESFFNATVDAALVMQTFILAAENVGLGCCPISVIRNHLPRVLDILSLPPRVIPIAGLCIGYPAGAGQVSMRLPPRITLHVDRYDDSCLGEELKAYDERREARTPMPREKQRAPETFGYVADYGWSEDKSRQACAKEGKEFGKMIREHGFSLD